MAPDERLTVEDRLDIMDLYARHAWAQDGGDLDAYADVFAPDAVAYGTNAGIVGIRAYLRSFIPDSAFPGSQHFAMNWWFVGGDRRRHKVRAYVMRLHRIPGTTNCQVVWQGFYSDTVVKVDGRWSFQIKQSPNAEELQARRLDFVPTPPQNKAAFDLYDLGHARAVPTPSEEDLRWRPTRGVALPHVSRGAGRLTAEDRLDIMELAARYAWAMDGGDADVYADAFVPDAFHDPGGGRRYGHAGIHAMEESFKATDSAFPGTKHFATQFLIRGDDRRASVHAYVVRFTAIPGTTSTQIPWMGYYTDTVVKRGGRWLFEQKKAHYPDELMEKRFGQEEFPGYRRNYAILYDLVGAALPERPTD